MGEVNKTSKILLLDLLEKSLKYFAFIIGFLFVCGLIITNLHLGQFGISEISFLRIRYLIAGFNFILFLLLPFIMTSFVILLSKAVDYLLEKEDLIPKLSFISTIILSVGLAILAIVIIETYLFVGDIQISHLKFKMVLDTNSDWLWLVGLLGVYFFIYELFISKEDKKRAAFLVQCISFSFVFIICLIIYTKKIHPKVHPIFAGGKPISADILISESGIPIIKSLDMNLDEKRYIRDVKIVYETAYMIYLMPKKDGEEKVKSIAFNKKIIEGIKLLSDKTDEEAKT